jgi:hypothetical protein
VNRCGDDVVVVAGVGVDQTRVLLQICDRLGSEGPGDIFATIVVFLENRTQMTGPQLFAPSIGRGMMCIVLSMLVWQLHHAWQAIEQGRPKSAKMRCPVCFERASDR